MKKFIKKIGVLGLIIAILSPYISMPNVKAASENCTTNLQNYLFLDVNWLTDMDGNESDSQRSSFLELYANDSDEPYLNYANFLYTFPENKSGVTTTISSIEVNNLDTNNLLKNFWNIYDDIINANSGTSWKNDYNSYEYTGVSGRTGAVLVKTGNKTYNTTSSLLHGIWGAYSSNGKAQITDWQKVKNGENISLQRELSDSSLKEKTNYLKEKMNIVISPAKYVSSNSSSSSGITAYRSKFSLNETARDFENIEAYTTSYIQGLIDNLDAAGDENRIWWDGESDSYYIPIAIARNIDMTKAQLKTFLDNNYTFGVFDGSKAYVYTTKSTSSTINASDIDTITDSYTAWKKTTGNKREITGITSKEELAEYVDFIDGEPYYWPAVFNVEYKTCSNGDSSSESWRLEYDGNTNDTSVSNIPSSKTENLGTDIEVDSLVPLRDGYKFQKWCTQKDGSGNCYNAGEKVPSPSTASTVTVYAQWAKTGTDDNKKTGVISYVIGFASVGIIAGVIYIVIKKKNLFKQI